MIRQWSRLFLRYRLTRRNLPWGRARAPPATSTGSDTTELAPLNPSDAGLVGVLLKSGLLTADQAQTALRHAREAQLDLRRSIIELDLIPAERFYGLAFDRLQILAQANGGMALTPSTEPQVSAADSIDGALATTSITPDRTQHQLDIRKELKNLSAPPRSLTWSRRSSRRRASRARPTSTSIRTRAGCASGSGSTASFRTCSSSTRRSWPP